ncbi:MAG: LysR substrate-binding domain-containing protein [Alphaproteobacteria bacterium]
MPPSVPMDVLRSFTAIADTGSFTRAAAMVLRTQPAVSQQMAKLEALVGKRLLERGDRGVTLTVEGTAFAGYARRILKLHDEAIAAIAEPELKGTVRFGMPDDYVARFLPPILAGCHREMPQIEIEMTCRPTSELVRMQAGGLLDVAVVTVGGVVREAEILAHEPLVWVTSERHLAHETEPLPLALFDPGCPCREAVCEALDRTGRPYRLVYSSPSHVGLLCAVQAGIAITAIPRSTVPAGLHVLGPEDGLPPLPDQTFGLLRGRNLSPGAQRFADYVAHSFARDSMAPAAAG